MKMAHLNSGKSILRVAALLALVTLACGLPSSLSPSSQPAAPAAAANALLPDPAAGLDGLTSYQVVLNQAVNGSLDGKPFQHSVHMEYGRTAAKDETFLRDITASGEAEAFLHTARIGAAYYSQAVKNGACQGGLLDAQQAPAEVPASLLLPVISADRVGSETVNGVPAVHYRFTKSGLQIASQDSPVSGEVWIASPGGYVVKYLLSEPAPTHPSGKGLETGQTWDYELKVVSGDEQINLPQDCTAVPVDIPAVSGAQNVTYDSGELDYSTSSDLATVVDFYDQKLPAAGWVKNQGGKPKDNSIPTPLYYHKGSQLLVITLDNSSAPLQVSVSLSKQDGRPPGGG